jgi:methionyl-tRNA formyltransferase
VRTVYLGTSEFAAVVLRALAASPHRPALVISRPDRPRGRGQRLGSPPVADAARELGVKLAQPESLDEPAALELIAAAAPEVICVCAFGALIREPLLSAYELLNVHPSLLPRWRGAAPIERALMAGDERTGVSIMRICERLDAGPVCLQQGLDIAPDDTYGSLAARLAKLAGDLLVRALEERPPCREQDERRATYAEKITARDRLLDPARAAVELERVVRALYPHIGAFIEAGGERLGVHAARVLPDGPPPGVLAVDSGRPVFGCAEGALELLVVHPPGRRAMSGKEYVRGRSGRARSGGRDG